MDASHGTAKTRRPQQVSYCDLESSGGLDAQAFKSLAYIAASCRKVIIFGSADGLRDQDKEDLIIDKLQMTQNSQNDFGPTVQ